MIIDFVYIKDIFVLLVVDEIIESVTCVQIQRLDDIPEREDNELLVVGSERTVLARHHHRQQPRQDRRELQYRLEQHLRHRYRGISANDLQPLDQER